MMKVPDETSHELVGAKVEKGHILILQEQYTTVYLVRQIRSLLGL